MVDETDAMKASPRVSFSEIGIDLFASVWLAIIINLFTDLVGSCFPFGPIYDSLYWILIPVSSVISILSFTYLLKRRLEITHTVVSQILVNAEESEVEHFEFCDDDGNDYSYSPQLHLSSAFDMTLINLQLAESQEKFGVLTWMIPNLLEKSERVSNFRSKIKRFLGRKPKNPKNPISDLMDRVLVNILQAYRNFAGNLGISDKTLVIMQNKTEKGVGGFTTREPVEGEERISSEELPKSILRAEVISSGTTESQDIVLEIPEMMKIDDVSSGKSRGINIHGGGIEFTLKHEYLRQQSPSEHGLVILDVSGNRLDTVVAVQYIVSSTIKLGIGGYLRNRRHQSQLWRWAQMISRQVIHDFDWASFKMKHRIAVAKKIDREGRFMEQVDDVKSNDDEH